MQDHVKKIDPEVEQVWRSFLVAGEVTQERRMRTFFRWLPKDPRCKNCNAPFEGIGSRFVKMVYGKRPSKSNPRLCNVCEDFALKHLGGAEVEISMLFGDVRGSTSLAEHMSVADFSHLIDRFFQVSADALIKADALIDKLVGDQVTGLFVPGYAGPQHARKAIEAAHQILRATGHGDPGGPWIPVGIGVHTGIAYVGAVGSRDGVVDITALGDAPNTAARLSSNAAAGEILVSEEAWNKAGLDMEAIDERHLQVKGREHPVQVRVLRITPDTNPPS